jgi:hypothetical protein
VSSDGEVTERPASWNVALRRMRRPPVVAAAARWLRPPWAARLALAVALALVPRAAAAHQQGVSYSDIEVDAGRVRYDLTIANHDLKAIDADGDGMVSGEEIVAQLAAIRRELGRTIGVETSGVACSLTLEDFLIDPMGGVVFRLRGTCGQGGPLRVRFDMLAATAGSGYNLAKIRYQGALVEHVFTRDDTEVVITGSAPGVLATVRRFLLLGVEHIATGYDHILFLLALLLIGGGFRTLVGIVTAFTVAHSVTLALATLDVVALPTRVVEPAIALSIAWVAIENVVLDRSHGRWRITFVFGLVHGFGFASILRAMHLPTQSLAASLVSFNLGVEVGQVAVVLLAYPVIVAVQRSHRRRAIVVVVSGAILALALYWFVQRAFF